MKLKKKMCFELAFKFWIGTNNIRIDFHSRTTLRNNSYCKTESHKRKVEKAESCLNASTHFARILIVLDVILSLVIIGWFSRAWRSAIGPIRRVIIPDNIAHRLVRWIGLVTLPHNVWWIIIISGLALATRGCIDRVTRVTFDRWKWRSCIHYDGILLTISGTVVSSLIILSRAASRIRWWSVINTMPTWRWMNWIRAWITGYWRKWWSCFDYNGILLSTESVRNSESTLNES